MLRSRQPDDPLTDLLREASTLDPDDRHAVDHFIGRAAQATRHLVDQGLLTPHLVVEPADPAVVAIRTVAVAARRFRAATAVGATACQSSNELANRVRASR